jgi:formylglycine-generating enzyme required for sulfatase activity
VSPDRRTLIIEPRATEFERSSSAAGSLFAVASVMACATTLLAACRETPRPEPSAAGTSGIATVTAGLRPVAASAVPAADAGAPPLVRVSELMPAVPPDACPATMAYVAGGEFWMGSPRNQGAREERPRFLTRVADFCIDTYEVTSASYMQCVEHGQCSAAHAARGTCNASVREDHPINCVDWTQADTYCKSQGSRLPTELEWEYAARGGKSYGRYSWGAEPPDDRSCWRSPQTCSVGSYAPGAFGLHDMSGNVWEWTNDWFGSYPWPAPTGRAKVYRGGGWGRRSEKWLTTTLRNRTTPSSWSSHLGFRCARLAKDARCPFGLGEEPGFCRHGVLGVECPGDQSFNGQRCAAAGAPPCARNEDSVPGHGCVRRRGEDPTEDTSEPPKPEE